MEESADIRAAADRLQSALQTLEGALDPLLERVSKLEKSAEESQSFGEDRAQLAEKLDEATAREQNYKAQQAEFAALAEETTEELDRVIRQVRDALGQAG